MSAIEVAARRFITLFDEQSQIAQRIVAGGRSDCEIRKECTAAIETLRKAITEAGTPVADAGLGDVWAALKSVRDWDDATGGDFIPPGISKTIRNALAKAEGRP